MGCTSSNALNTDLTIVPVTVQKPESTELTEPTTTESIVKLDDEPHQKVDCISVYKAWHCNQNHEMHQVELTGEKCTRCLSAAVVIACECIDHVKLCEDCFGMTCDGAQKTSSDHRLIQSNQPEQVCTLCKKFDGIEKLGTMYSCGARCHYNICEQCYCTKLRSTSRGATGNFIKYVMNQKMKEQKTKDQKDQNDIKYEEKYEEKRKEKPQNPTSSALSSREVVEFVSDVDVMFSFASATGGLALSKYLRDKLLTELPSVLNEKSVYIDCVNLRNQKDTFTTTATNAKTGENYTKIQNPHWAEFYYASMLFSKTVVIIFDVGWRNSNWCLGEWCLFLKHSNTLFDSFSKTFNFSSGKWEENAYAYRLIVIYPEDEIDSVNDIKSALKTMNANEHMLKECVIIPAIINANGSSMTEKHLDQFVDTIRINNEYMDKCLHVDQMDEETKLKGISTIYEKYWKQKAIDVMNDHSWWEEEKTKKK